MACDPALEMRVAQGSLSGPPSHQVEDRSRLRWNLRQALVWEMGRLFT